MSLVSESPISPGAGKYEAEGEMNGRNEPQFKRTISLEQTRSLKINRSIRPVLTIKVPWKSVWKHYRDWNRTSQGEPAVVSYLAAHPEFLDAKLKKAKIDVPNLELAGLEVVFPRKKGETGRFRRADMVFRSDENFVIVSAKENDEKAALGDAEYYARLLRDHLVENDLDYGWIKPVAVMMSGYPDKAPRGWGVGDLLDSSGL
ncbi:MAG: hypothetical protein OK438_04395 [Thaumarchaeota archaeon]|nr:hypothetical protein [Nitrososphaerota archaeon]